MSNHDRKKGKFDCEVQARARAFKLSGSARAAFLRRAAGLGHRGGHRPPSVPGVPAQEKLGAAAVPTASVDFRVTCHLGKLRATSSSMGCDLAPIESFAAYNSRHSALACDGLGHISSHHAR